MSTNTAETVTDDHVAEPAPDTVTEEPIVPVRNEETENALTDAGEPAATGEEGEPSADAKPPEDKPSPEPKRPKVSAMPDGTYVIRNADGTEVKLTEEQANGLIRKRIDREVYRRHEAEREAARLRKELETAKNAKPDEKPGEKPAQPDPDDPRPSWENQEWDSMDQYQDALYEWRQRQETKQPPKSDTQDSSSQPDDAAQFAAWQKKATEVLQDGAQRFQDWDAVVRDNQNAPFDGMFTSYVFAEAEDAAAILYELGQHPDEAQALHAHLVAGDAVKAARALGKIEARLDRGQRPETDADDTGSPSTDEAARPRPAVRRAPEPPPITPLTTSRASGVSTHKDPNKMTQREFEAWRAAGGS